MRIFNKNFLKPFFSGKMGKQATISKQNLLRLIVDKGFARNFKPRGELSEEGGNESKGERNFTPNTEHAEVRIPKYTVKDNSESEGISTPQRRGGQSRFDDDKFNPRSKPFRKGFEAGGEEEGAGFGERRGGFREDRGGFRGGDREFKPRRSFDDNRGGDREFRPRRSFDDRGGDRGADREFRPRRRFDENSEGSERPFRPRSDFRSDRFGGDRQERGDRDRGDRPPRFNREDRFGGDRQERGDRPPRFNREDRFGGDRQDRGDRPPRFNREDRFGGDRQDRADRPPRFNREDKFGGDRPPRFNREDRFGGDRQERPEKSDRGFPKKERKRPDEDQEEDFTEFDLKLKFDATETNEEGQGLTDSTSKTRKSENFNSFARDNMTKDDSTAPKTRLTLSDLKSKKASPKSESDVSKISSTVEDLLNKEDTDTNSSDVTKVNSSVEDLIKDSFKSNINTTKNLSMKTQEGESTSSSSASFDYKDSKNDYIYGAHAVEAAVTFSYRKNLELLVQSNYQTNTPEHIQRVLETAKSKGIAVKYLPRERMDKFTGGRPHNGLVLKSDPRDYVYVKAFESFQEKFIYKPEGNLIVLLDQIIDPQNFGSIIRSSFFLGSDAILVNRKNRPPISSTVCKVSSGASECTELFAVKNVRSFLSEALTKGWTVVTTSIEKEHDVQIRLNVSKPQEKEEEKETTEEKITEAKTLSLTELNLPKACNVILVLGSEANGITSNVTGVSSYNIYIPPLLNKDLTGQPPYNIIDSLNVGVSAGIIINHLKSQLKSSEKSESTTENVNLH